MLKAKRFTLLIVLALGTALILAACGGASTPAPVDQTVTMSDSFKFDPAAITVEPGAQVTLHLKNTGALVHSFYLMEKGYKAQTPFGDADKQHVIKNIEVSQVQPGDSQDLTFTAPTDPGDYEFVCGTPGHLEGGMMGTLTVAAP